MTKKDYLIPLGISFERYMDKRDLEGEIWKRVVGYEKYFLISNMGRLKTLPRPHVKERIKTPKSNGNGYWCHDFCIDNKHRYKYIHRLVAEAFIPNPENKAEVDHLNTNRADNRLCNLQWVSHYENQFNGITIQNIKSSRFKIPIVQLSILGEYITRWDSSEHAAALLGINSNCIIANTNNKTMCAGGFLFVKEEDYLNNKFKLPIANSATLSAETGIPAKNSVAVFLDDRLVDAFSSDSYAAFFYKTTVSVIDTTCKRAEMEGLKENEIVMKYFKSLNNKEQMTVRRILLSKRRIVQ